MPDGSGMGGEVSGCEGHQLPSSPPSDAADHVPAALLGIAAALAHGRVVVHALQADPARAGEAVEHEVAGPAAQQAGLEPVHLLGHRHRVVAVQPAAGLDVDRLAGLEPLLEHVAVAVHPDDALVVGGVEVVDEEATAVHHVGEALDPAVVVLHAAGRGQELVLADHDPVAGLEVQRGDVAGRITAERDLARGLRLEQQQRHPAERTPLQALLERVQADLHARVLPQQHVVLEVHRHLAVERHVQDGHELALEPVVDAWRRALRDLGREDLRGCRHRRLSPCVAGDGRARQSGPRPRRRPRYRDRASVARVCRLASTIVALACSPPARLQPGGGRCGGR